MKYGYIFLCIIALSFGGACIGAIKYSQDYLAACKTNCCSMNEINTSCQSTYYGY